MRSVHPWQNRIDGKAIIDRYTVIHQDKRGAHTLRSREIDVTLPVVCDACNHTGRTTRFSKPDHLPPGDEAAAVSGRCSTRCWCGNTSTMIIATRPAAESDSSPPL